MSDPMAHALSLSKKDPSRYVRTLVEVVMVAMLEGEGHAEMARLLIASLNQSSDVQLANTSPPTTAAARERQGGMKTIFRDCHQLESMTSTHSRLQGRRVCKRRRRLRRLGRGA